MATTKLYNAKTIKFEQSFPRYPPVPSCLMFPTYCPRFSRHGLLLTLMGNKHPLPGYALASTDNLHRFGYEEET